MTETSGTPRSDRASGSAGSSRCRFRWSAVGRRLRGVLTVLALGGPVALYGAVVAADGVNAFYVDDWNSVDIVRRLYQHGLRWNVLWSQHNENRMVVPNLISFGLARATGLDVRVELWLSFLLLCVAVALVVAAHRRRCRDLPLIVYAPVVFLAFSLTQVQNTLWGFQLAWYLVLACLAAAYLVLDRTVLSWWWWLAAAVVGVCGSVSSVQGLLVWPVGALLLVQRGHAWPKVLSWVAVGVTTTILYVHGLDQSLANPFPNFILHNPGSSLDFLAFLVGDVLGVPVGGFRAPVAGSWAIYAFGAVLLVTGVLVVVVLGLRRDRRSAAPVGVALVLTGLLFGVLTTQGRGFYGTWGASQGRYVTYDLLVPMGSYLALLGALASGRTTASGRGGSQWVGDPDGDGSAPWRASPAISRLRSAWGRRLPPRRWVTAALGVMIALTAVQVAVGTHEGLTAARTRKALSEKVASVALSIDREPDPLVTRYLYPGGSATWLRRQAAFARRQRLGPFRSGPVPSPP